MLTLARKWPQQKYYPRGKRDITDADGQSAETRMDIGSPSRARTYDLRIDMASIVKGARTVLLFRAFVDTTQLDGRGDGLICDDGRSD